MTAQEQKTFLIFGGIGGVGGALADLLTQEGHQVFVTTKSPEKMSQTSLPPAQVLQADVLDHGAIEEAVRRAGANGLHGLAYCVGSINLKPLARTTPEDLLQSFQINTLGAFVAMKEAAELLAAQQGSAVLFSSIAATRGFTNHAAVGTAKAALEGLACSLAADLAPRVRISVIAPSLTDTPLASPYTKNPKMVETISAMHPIARLGQAHEMAKAAAFLLSDDAGWMTGQVIHIDGGRSRVETR